MSPRPVFEPFEPVALVTETRARLPADLFPLTEQLRTCIKYQQVQTGRGAGQWQTGSPSLSGGQGWPGDHSLTSWERKWVEGTRDSTDYLSSFLYLQLLQNETLLGKVVHLGLRRPPPTLLDYCLIQIRL